MRTVLALHEAMPYLKLGAWAGLEHEAQAHKAAGRPSYLPQHSPKATTDVRVPGL